MDLWLWIVLAALGAAVIGAVALLMQRGRRHARPVARAPDSSRVPAGVVVLDVGDADPSSTTVQRLVQEAASRARAADPSLHVVEVRSRTGKLLGRVAPPKPRPVTPARPGQERRSTRHAPAPPRGFEGEIHPSVTPHFDPAEHVAPKRPLADIFELDESVRAHVADTDDPSAIVRAILKAAGVPAHGDGNVIRCGDDVLILIPERHAPLLRDSLNTAYMQFRSSGASRGVVICMGHLDLLEARRRELLAPALRHSGREAIQRMADAAALGENPIAFVLGPAVYSPDAPGSGRRFGRTG